MIGYVCALEALTLSLMAYFTVSKYRQVPNEDEADLCPDRGREMSPMSSRTNYNDYANHTNTNKIDGYALNNHTNCNQTISSPECNQKPYIPGNSDKQNTFSNVANANNFMY